MAVLLSNRLQPYSPKLMIQLILVQARKVVHNVQHKDLIQANDNNVLGLNCSQAAVRDYLTVLVYAWIPVAAEKTRILFHAQGLALFAA